MNFVVDKDIPHISQRLEKAGNVRMVKNSEMTPSNVRDADVLVIRTRGRYGEALLSGSNVKLIGSAAIGLDHVDIPWCEANGITVANAPGCNAPGVMQYVVCSLHAAGFDPSRHTLGVVGNGNIGSLVAKTVRKAGGRVIVNDPPRERAGIDDEQYVSLPRLLEQADAVTFHVPLTRTGEDATFHLLNRSNIGLLKDNAIVINASRGGVIDEEAALEAGDGITWIIDTWEGEPRLNIRMMERAFISTPHIAGYSEEGKQRASRSVIEAINKQFSTDIDTSGLADYSFRLSTPEYAKIVTSYNPLTDCEILRNDPENFEIIRNSYIFRKEG